MRSGTILWADLGQVWVGIWVDLGRVWVGSGTGSGGLGRDLAGSGEVWVGIWRGPAGGPNSVKNGSRSGSGSGVIWGSQKWSFELESEVWLGSGSQGPGLGIWRSRSGNLVVWDGIWRIWESGGLGQNLVVWDGIWRF